MRGVHRLPSQEPVPAPVAFRNPSSVLIPFAVWLRKTFFRIPLQRHIGFKPSRISF
jgi:hypothetical protein